MSNRAKKKQGKVVPQRNTNLKSPSAAEEVNLNESGKHLLNGSNDPAVIPQNMDFEDLLNDEPKLTAYDKTNIHRASSDLNVANGSLTNATFLEKRNTADPIADRDTMMTGYNGKQASLNAGSKMKNPFKVDVKQQLRGATSVDNRNTGLITVNVSGNRTAVHPSDTSTTVWKDKYDNNQVYNLEKSFALSDPLDAKRRELARWNSQDIKGSRRTLYTKEVLQQNQDILTVVKQSRLEQVNNYTDGHKCLPFRKRVMRFRVIVSDGATVITTNRFFEGFIILIIGLNCITLAQSDSTKEETVSQKNIELAFQFMYTIEMTLRIFSLGFVFNKGAYLRSPWNQLDFITVMTGFSEMIGGGGSLAALRAFRVLRPLRTINQIEGLRIVVQSVMAAIPLLQDTILILIFFMLIFAIGGLNLFMGMLMQRCVNIETGAPLLDDGETVICTDGDCPTGFYCGKLTLNPNYDVTNFDNIFWALLNVFQCITLEGWSEIMVMYQKAYTPIVFFFFVSLVFIGAFFFLNLTLAVINSSYSEAQARIKGQKEKLKAEQNNLVRESSDEANATVKRRGATNQLGLQEFFIAKRVAAKLKAFRLRHLDEKEVREAQAKVQQQAEKEAIKQAQQAERNRRQEMLKKQKLKKKLNTPQRGDAASSLNNEDKSDNAGSAAAKDFVVNVVDLEGFELSDMNGMFNGSMKAPISEEEDFEGEDFSDDVNKFLQEIENHEADPQQPVSARALVAQKAGPVNAFLDARIASQSPLKKHPQGMDSKLSANKPSKNLISQTITRMDGQNSEEDQHDWVLKELDFDAVIGNTKERLEGIHQVMPQSARVGIVTPKSSNMIASNKGYAHDLPFDIGARVLDSQRPAEQRRHNFDQSSLEGLEVMSNFPSSIISSDDSIGRHLESIQNQTNTLINPSFTKREKKKQKEIQSKQIGHKLRRMLTGDFAPENKRSMEDMRPQIDLMSSLQLAKSTAGPAKFGKKTSSINMPSVAQKDIPTAKPSSPLNKDANQTIRSQGSIIEKTQQNQKARRDRTLQIYAQIDKEKWFSVNKPKDPAQYVERVQKVIINPGVPYVSTSQDEIFERRILATQQEQLEKLNSFIKAPEKEHGDEDAEDGRYEAEEEEVFISNNYSPYQLKTLYKIKEQQEIEWDDDDEDALILSQQPFETVMQIGFKDFLNHLSTKFIARRSDIIVSSTLSITLTPEDDGFVPIKFAKIGVDEINKFVAKRSIFRSMSVQSNTIPRKRDQHWSSVEILPAIEEDSESEEEDNSNEVPQEFAEGSVLSGKSPSLQEQKSSLPATLLTAPLTQKKVAQLKEKDKKLYNIQRTKYELIQKSLSKKALHLSETMFSLEEAKQLIQGNYHMDEEEMIARRHENEAIIEHGKLNRAMNNGIKAFDKELELENFEQKIILEEIKEPTIGVSIKSKGDHIPQELKDAFNLPTGIDYEIDFDQVRIVDNMFKKKMPVWSGQDVLDIGLNLEKSSWVLAKMNKVRVWPKGFFNTVKRVRYVMKSFVRLSLFENFLTLAVLINTIVMAMDSYDIDEKTQSDLEFLNEIFTWIFIVEMTLKLLARGPRKYASERMNLLDGAVVILSIVEMIMESVGGGGGAGNLQAFRTVRVFRTFRVLRVTRILRSLKSMAMIIGVIQRAFMDFILITILMFVFIFIYTLLGRQIFQGNYDFGPDEELPRGNYETFTVAFVTVFQILTMENWQQVLYGSMKAAEGSMVMKTITAVFYISWIFIGNFILLNLFLAILIDSFGEADAELDMTDEQKAAEEQRQKENQARLQAEKDKRMKKLGTSKKALDRLKTGNMQKFTMKKTKASFTGGKRLFNENLIEDVEDLDNNTIRLILIDQGLLKAKKGEIDNKLVGPEIMAENSVYLFGRHSCFRRNVHFIQKHHYFERFIMLLIALSSTKLALESYIRDEPPDSVIVQVSGELDFIFNYLFIIEMLLKVIALGFAMDDGSYLRDSWNGLDFFIVVTSIIDMALTNTDIPALKVLRLLRMIRPLRVISHNPQLKMIVAALFESVGSIVNVSVVVIIIWLMFAIYGMNTYMGMFFYCSEQPYKLNTKWVCEDNGGKWLRFDSNFDDIGQAMVTLFIVSSLEGWPDIMYQAIDITLRDNGPKYENSPAQSAFFIVFILIGSFFFLNFFIGVLFLKYEQAQKKEEAGFTKKQLYWLEIQQLVIRAQTPHELRYRPQQNPRLQVWKMIQTNAFEMTIMACIVLNMLQMALDHEGRDEQMVIFLQISNYFFTGIFLFEAVIKLYVYRLPYFKTAWNKFDFFVVCSSLIDLGLEFALPKPEGGNEDEGSSQILTVGPQLARVLRVLRVSRVLRLAGKYKGLQSLLKTIQMSVSSLINVFILLMLIFFIMAVLGNSLFYEVTEGNVIDEWKNFNNFHMSFSLLFSISTGEDWNRIMYDCNSSSSFAIVFFLTFIVLVSYVMLNLFILVIIQQFSKYYLEEDNPLSRFEEDFEDFKDAWKLFTDKYQCTKISLKHLDKFIIKLPVRIRQKVNLTETSREVDIQRIIIKMGATVDDGFIYFNEMLYRLMRAQFGNVKMNKVMALNELVTQFRITELTLQAKQETAEQKANQKKFKENIFFSQLRAASANPFLTQMYYRTSFKTWQQYVRSILEKQIWERQVVREREMHKTLGKEFVEPVFKEKDRKLEEVEIERELMLEMSCSSDEAGSEIDSKSRRSGTLTMKHSLLSRRDTYSPQSFRKKARKRLFLSGAKFTIGDMQSSYDQQRQGKIVSGEIALKSNDTQFYSNNSNAMGGQAGHIDQNELAKVELAKKFNSLQKAKFKSSANLLGFVVENEEYKGGYVRKQTFRSPKSGINGPFAQLGKADK